MSKTPFSARVFRHWKTSLGGLVLGLIQIISGISESDTQQIITGTSTVLGGLIAQD